MRESNFVLMKSSPAPETAGVVAGAKPEARPEPRAAHADAEDRIIADGLRIALRVMLSRFPGLQEADAKDLAQELAVEFWLHRESVKSPEAWFRACAVHKAQRFLARRRFNSPLDGVPDPTGPSAAPREPALQQVYFTMQSRCRRLLGLVVIAGCRPEELAANGGPSVRTVYQNTARCLKTLRLRWLRLTASPLTGTRTAP